MFTCSQCGVVASKKEAKFCGSCGFAYAGLGSMDPLADLQENWTPEEIDQDPKVKQYISMMTEFYFDLHDISDVLKYSARIREKLKISFETQKSTLNKLEEKKKSIAHLSSFKFEFNENVLDAYAGGDTFLNFRYTNLSEDDFFKMRIFWDDPETERIDLKAETKSLIKPKASVTLSASAIFDRIGIKELSDFQIIITDQFGDEATFRAEPFSFRVLNPDQRITQNISTHNQISIEGRGVVDASGMGADRSAPQGAAENTPRWRNLSFSYMPTSLNDEETNVIISQVPLVEEVSSQQPLETDEQVDSTKINFLTFDKNNLLSVLKAADQGNAEAQVTLGKMYETGNGVSKDDEQAATWYRKAAEQGHADAQNLIAYFYNNGIGLAQNFEKAAAWFIKAAQQGHAKAQFNLGLAFFHGEGVDQSNEQAARWYLKAAEQGLAIAETALGRFFQEGCGVNKNEEQAVHWYQKAAEKGDADAQNLLGFCYQNGIGVAENNEQAVRWYRRSAEQGHAPGQTNLGFMLYHGLGVVEDEEAAAHWFNKGAAQGHSEAQHNLAVAYEGGFGVAQDKEKAKYWYRKAAEQGYENAIESLKQLESSIVTGTHPTNGYGTWDYGDYSYSGLFKDGLFNGLGELTWSGKDLGHKYVGNFVNGQRTGQGTHHFPDGTTQVGIFENGVFQESQNAADDSEEYLSWEDGSSYRGRVENGKPEGFGHMTFANGDSMYGIFVNGIMYDDTAHYDFSDGGTYDGPMVNGQFNGVGTRKFGGQYIGHTYVGNFYNGYFNGHGTYSFPDGSKNVGEFQNGTFVPENQSKPDYVYVGATLNGIPHGVGKMTWDSGAVYKGDFVNGLCHGLGELTLPDKTQLTGRFENNEFVKNASFTDSVKIGYKTASL